MTPLRTQAPPPGAIMADADAAAASAGRQRQAKARRGGRPKLRPPQREGWMDVYEELARVAYLETDEHEYRRKWVLLRDSWMYLYDNQEDVMLGRDAETMLAIDLRGSLCQRQPKLERTFVLESSALYTVHGHKHKMLFRTAAEEDVQVRGQCRFASRPRRVALCIRPALACPCGALRARALRARA